MQFFFPIKLEFFFYILFKVVESKSRRLELKFRPSNGYCNPACGDRNQTVGFLLRVRVKKSRIEKVEAETTTTNENKTTMDKNVNDGVTNHNDSCQKNSIDKEKTEMESKHGETNYNSIDKNKSPSFDKKKYENLSQDLDYSLPKLKVLGKVDTEFRFTSKKSLNHNYIFSNN